ncbi:MAG: D-sedoheptulose-7-phosphate isomerase [Phycisphaerales bacterium]|jgi:D-sedoheptulose 7-phosphate isomerase
MPPTAGDILRSALSDAQSVLATFVADQAAMRASEAAGGTLMACYDAGCKAIICGNGGSLCDAAHFAEELTGRFRADRPPLPAIALSEPGHLTCTANDYGFEHVFSRSVQALGAAGDVLIVLSTSGNSANCVKACEAARAKGMTTIGLLGKGGGRLLPVCDHAIVVPGATSDRIQELHMLVLHIWVEMIESAVA